MSRCKLLVVILFACKGGAKSADPAPQPARAFADEGAMGKAASTPAMLKPAPEADAKETNEPAKDAPAAHYGTGGAGRGVGSKQKAEETATRAWFPETFLFEPLVVTDDAGAATVPVRVPDRLTTWHVLALAHSRDGAQGGAVTSFLGTLPTYVDPIVPKRLVIGDQIRLPIQLVNTTASPVAGTLTVAADHATITGGGARTIPAQGSLVEYATLSASHAGTVVVRATLGGTDAVQRSIDVAPAGREITTTQSGTLAAPRTLSIEGPAGSDPTTDRARLLVFPGALALLRSELGASTARGGVADDAYALLLAGRATQLLGALGDKPDPEALRALTILTGQRVIRDARTLDVTTATLLTEAALAHPQNAVLARLGERAAAYLGQAQRPDGTFSGATGWTLQRVLVATADGARAVGAATTTPADRQRAMAVRARAAGAFERNAEHVLDGYTAAAIVASGAVTGELADKLRDKIRAAIKDARDGARYLEVPEGVVRADGTVPSTAEATALAVLALPGDPKAADLGATLLGSYDPDRGWGDGRTNLACIQAVVELFKTPVPDHVAITLTMDGKPVAAGTLDRASVREVLALDVPAPGLAGKHEWKLVAEPAVPGLGYSLSLHGWVPWQKETTHGGLELALPAHVAGTVGKPIELAISAIAPSGVAVHIEQALPAGVQVDTPSLQELVSAGTIQRFEAADGKLELFVAPLAPGQTFAAKLRVIPTLAGTLHAGASKIDAGGTEFHVPPTEWAIR